MSEEQFGVPAELVKEYQENGVVVLRGLLTSSEVDTLREEMDKVIASPGPLYEEQSNGSGALFHDDEQMWIRSKGCRNIVFNSKLGRAAQALMTKVGKAAPHVHLFFDELFSKEPGAIKETPWHNDVSYWPLHPKDHILQSMSLWCALDNVSKEVCPKYVRKSHNWNLHHRISNFGGRDKYAGNTQVAELPDNLDKNDPSVQGWELNPGDVVIHDAWTVHMAPGNPTTERRRAYVVRYATQEAKYDTRPGTMHSWWKSMGFGPGLDTFDSLEKSAIFPRVL